MVVGAHGLHQQRLKGLPRKQQNPLFNLRVEGRKGCQKERRGRGGEGEGRGEEDKDKE